MGQFEKSQQIYLSLKEGEAISSIENTVFLDAEKLGLVPIYETKSGKESTMDHELDICNRVHEIATYNMRMVTVKIKMYSMNKPLYIQIRIFFAKENEATKQVNYTLNELKEMCQILGDFMFVDSFKHQ